MNLPVLLNDLSSIDELDFGEKSHRAYTLFKQIKLKEGDFKWSKWCILCKTYDEDLWKGQGESWAQFLEAEHEVYSSVMKGIRVFRFYALKHYLELGSIDKDDLEKLYNVETDTLDRAREVITGDNVSEWVEKLSEIKKRDDIRQAINEAKGKDTEEVISKTKISELQNLYSSLPPEGQRLFKSIMNTNELRSMFRKLDKLNKSEWEVFTGWTQKE